MENPPRRTQTKQKDKDVIGEIRNAANDLNVVVNQIGLPAWNSNLVWINERFLPRAIVMKYEQEGAFADIGIITLSSAQT